MKNELDNGVVNPENKCFCRKGHCLKAGLIDVTDCYYGKRHLYIYYLAIFLSRLSVQM